jgi:hypothetical protein
MSLKPPSLWIEQRGRQHRVYWRNGVPGLPTRSYVPFYGREEAGRFGGMASLLGLDTARRVVATEDPQEAAALLEAALAERGLAPVDPGPAAAPLVPAGPPLSVAPAGAPIDPRLNGVTFRNLWQTFLDRQHHVEEGTRSRPPAPAPPPGSGPPRSAGIGRRAAPGRRRRARRRPARPAPSATRRRG